MDTHTITGYDDLSLTLSEAGTGRPILVLHGGGGRVTVAALGEHLSTVGRVIVPTHPGWDGTTRPDWLTGIDDLAIAYLDHLRDQGLRDVLVVGSSLGGWIAAEMAVRDRTGTITGLVLIDAVGIRVPGEPIRDFFALDAHGVAEYAWHDSARYYEDPAQVPADRAAARQANMATMRIIAGDPYMHDPKLLGRLARVSVPTLLVWGDSDQIVTPAYGAAYAAALPDGRLAIVPQAGHLPQIEAPEHTYTLIDTWVRETP